MYIFYCCAVVVLLSREGLKEKQNTLKCFYCFYFCVIVVTWKAFFSFSLRSSMLKCCGEKVENLIQIKRMFESVRVIKAVHN